MVEVAKWLFQARHDGSAAGNGQSLVFQCMFSVIWWSQIVLADIIHQYFRTYGWHHGVVHLIGARTSCHRMHHHLYHIISFRISSCAFSPRIFQRRSIVLSIIHWKCWLERWIDWNLLDEVDDAFNQRCRILSFIHSRHYHYTHQLHYPLGTWIHRLPPILFLLHTGLLVGETLTRGTRWRAERAA